MKWKDCWVKYFPILQYHWLSVFFLEHQTTFPLRNHWKIIGVIERKDQLMIDDNVALSWYCWRQDTLLNRSIDATFNQRTFWKERILPLHTISMVMMMTISNVIKKIHINHWEDGFKSAVPSFINVGNRF